MLQFFFGWMIIYTPLYLHENLGFDWSSIGIIFTIMLLPYVLFEVPLGKLADTILGEKEILILGFIITAISTMAMAFMHTTELIPWIIILFITRVGASSIEVMNETYFFKKVRAEDTTAIEIFRIMRPAGYILAPLVASAFIPFIEARYLFLIIGLTMFIGVYAGARIVDTK
jgi:MFS family permease